MYIPFWLVVTVLILTILAVIENKRTADKQEKEIRNEFGAITEWLLLKMLYINNPKEVKEKYKDELLGDLNFIYLNKFYNEWPERRFDVDIESEDIPNFNSEFELKFRAEYLPNLEKKYMKKEK